MPLANLYQNYPPKSKADALFFLLVVSLILFGFIMIISSSTVVGLNMYKDSFFFVKRHFVFFILGSLAFITSYLIPHQFWRKIATSFWILSLLLILLTYLPRLGVTVGGSSRWIKLLGFRFQPSEVLKFTLILFIAHYIDENKDNLFDIRQVIMPLLSAIGISILLVLKQPDLGTSIVMGVVSFAMLFIGGFPFAYLSGLATSSGIIVIVSVFRNPYQMSRIKAFLDPWADPYGKGFHIIQSLIAVGTGGVLGLGLGQSRQKFLYLPQQYTDFIFAIIGEEFGFLATTIFLFVFFLFIYRAVLISIRADNLYSKLLVMGLILWIAIQAIVNISVTLNLMPITGITLPFISFGGTSLIMTMWISGIILNISRYRDLY